MAKPESDQRNPDRRARDEQIAAEPKLPTPGLPADAAAEPIENHLARSGRRPIAVPGVVENGLVRPLDTGVVLPEHARVIIIASETQT